jgi:hypothetical protein
MAYDAWLLMATTTIATRTGFLTLPPELRADVYEAFLADHVRLVRRQQPSNRHLRLLQVCRTTYDEAKGLLHRYVSLRHEHQIRSFADRALQEVADAVHWADVANDARLIRKERDVRGRATCILPSY